MRIHRAMLKKAPVLLLAVMLVLGALVLFQYSQTPCAFAAAECPVGSRTTISDDLTLEFGTAFDVVITGAPTQDVTLTLPTAVSSSLVAASSTDTLTNKTLVGVTIGATDWTTANHAHAAADSGGTIGADIGVKAFHNANQSIANSTVTVLALNSERWDTDTIHDNVTNNSRLTATTAGKYTITGNISWSNNATGRRQLSIIINGGSTIALVEGDTNQNQAEHQVIATIYDMAATDYVEMAVFQTSGGSLSVITNGFFSPEFSIQRH